MMSHASNRNLMKSFLVLLCLGCLLGRPLAQAPVETPASGTNEIARIESVLATLEDPVKREAFVSDLKTVLEHMKGRDGVEERKGVNTLIQNLLTVVSSRLDTLSNQLKDLLSHVSTVSRFPDWIRNQTGDEEKRGIWKEIILNFFLILGSGYAVYYLLELGKARMTRPMFEKTPATAGSKFFLKTTTGLLSTMPLLGFAIASYSMATLLSPRDQTRLVALAWVHASILVRGIMLIEDFLLAPRHSALRYLPCDDETALFLHIWTRRLSLMGIYGYFTIQTASLLGLDDSVYQASLKLFGFLLLVLMAVFVFQVRQDVAHFIADDHGKLIFRSARKRLSLVWHWVTLIYLVALYFIWVFAIPEGPEFLARTTIATAVLLTLWGFTMRAVNNLWKRGLTIPAEWKSRFPGLEDRANRYLPFIQKSSGSAITTVTCLIILQVWGLDILKWLGTDSGKAFLYSLLKIMGIALISVMIWEIISISIAAYLAETDAKGNPKKPSARAKTLLTVAQKAVFVGLSVMSILLILSEIGVNTAPLLAAAGVLGLAVGFGSQTLVKDIINGFFILLEDLFAVGDVINVGGTAGLVEAVSIRNVRLRDFAGVVHTIPYSSIATISNLTKEFSMYVFDIGVAYRENVDEVMDVMKAVGAELKNDPEIGPLMLDSVEVVGVDKFADSAVMIKGRIKTVPLKQWTVGRAFNRRLKFKFDELGIEIPFPHQTLYFGSDKDGSAVPAKLEVLSGKGMIGGAASESTTKNPEGTRTDTQ